MSNSYKESLLKERKLLNIGHNNYIVLEQVVAILESGPLPVKRLRDQAVKENKLIDATAGRKTRTLLVTNSNHVVLSALGPDTLQERMESFVKNDKGAEENRFV